SERPPITLSLTARQPRSFSKLSNITVCPRTLDAPAPKTTVRKHAHSQNRSEAQARRRSSTLSFPRPLAVRDGGTSDGTTLNPNAAGCEVDDTDPTDNSFNSVTSLVI
ncbi:MAG: hypothetical protein L7U64_07630, partial [Luminiphilus sp.]|nr:hypothetical protein [Luminiphilus sp.]